MLFSHAGCEVKSTFIDKGEEWISDSAIRHVCANTVLSESHRPNWFFSAQTFDMTVVVAPSSLTQQLLIAGVTNDPILEFILQTSYIIRVLQTKQLMSNENDDSNQKLSFKVLPEHINRLSDFYKQFFGECIAIMAARRKIGKKSFYMQYSVPESLKSIATSYPAWLLLFQQKLIDAGLKKTESINDANLIIDAYDGPHIDADGRLITTAPVFTDKSMLSKYALHIGFIAPSLKLEENNSCNKVLLVQRNERCLYFIDRHSITRSIPDLTGQCCYSRFCSYIVNELSAESMVKET